MDNKNILKDVIFADLHIHSRFSRACSKNLNIPNLVKYAKIKGVGLLGTGDFQHPEWFKELDSLEEREGILYYDNFPFLWQTELSLMYTHNGKGRRVHYVLLAPNKEVVKQIIDFLKSKGRLDYDGRPIFGFSSIELVEAMEKIDNKIEIIPAHCMTPWFGVFGSNSGYENLEEAFEEKVNKIHAIESGISADPEMLWRLNTGKSIVSFSDLHSYWPFRLGREATIFNLRKSFLSYNDILHQIRENSFDSTVEVESAYGRYHFDGHRNCNFSCSPAESKKIGNICPKCKKKLTIGVDHRIEDISKNPFGFKPPEAKKFYKLLPLHELIGLAFETNMQSKKAWDVYNSLIVGFGNEFNILLNVLREDLIKANVDAKLVGLIMKNRSGNIWVRPGFDGVYGVAEIGNKQKI